MLVIFINKSLQAQCWAEVLVIEKTRTIFLKRRGLTGLQGRSGSIKVLYKGQEKEAESSDFSQSLRNFLEGWIS